MPTSNADELQAIADGWEGRAGAPTDLRPTGLSGKQGQSTFSGNASATAFVVTHGLGKTPTNVQVTPTTAVASALHAVTARTTTTFTITYAAAPAAATDNIKVDWQVS